MNATSPPKRAPTPSSAYDPRFKDVFLRGRKEPFSIEFDSAGEAIKFRQRAQQYRKAVYREGDKELAKILYQVTLRIDKAYARRLIVEPADAQFDSVFRSVGHQPTISVEPTASPQPVEPDEPPSLTQLLQDIDGLSEEP